MSFVHFIFNLERRLNFTFLFVLYVFINSSLVFQTILPYCKRNTDIFENKFKILLYLTLLPFHIKVSYHVHVKK